MNRRFKGLVMLASVIVWSAWALSAQADVLPDPQRPTDWDEHPAQGGLLAALSDVERALVLDAFVSYRATYAVLLDALGRCAEARREIDIALAEAQRASDGDSDSRVRRVSFNGFWDDDPRRDEERARVHATRGMIAFREGDFEAAKEDLQRALTLHPTGFHAHSLGAALYALGDVQGALEVEARSVELTPTDTRYRWALVMSLRKLGRGDEAEQHARQILQLEPDISSHRERFARLFCGGSSLNVNQP